MEKTEKMNLETADKKEKVEKSLSTSLEVIKEWVSQVANGLPVNDTEKCLSCNADNSSACLSVDNTSISSNFDEYRNLGTSTGTDDASITYAPYTIPSPSIYNPLSTFTQLYDDIKDSPKKELMSKEDMEDILSEIEDKDKECDSKIDEVFEQMRSDRTKTSVLNPVFQYYVGMKEGLNILIEKIKKYLVEE